MKIEKITENKIRIVVNLDELSNNNIDFKNFMIGNIESQKFFLDILNKAEKDFGFNTKDCKLLIESFSSLDEFFVFTITKYHVDKKKKRKYKLKYKKSNRIMKNPVYKFSSFEEFCSLCLALNNANISLNSIAKKISLYLYNNTYYLVLFDLNLSYLNFKKLFSIFSEFAFCMKTPFRFDAKLIEYGKPIIKQNALITGIKYFA